MKPITQNKINGFFTRTYEKYYNTISLNKNLLISGSAGFLSSIIMAHFVAEFSTSYVLNSAMTVITGFLTYKVSWISSEPIEVGFLISHNQSAEDTDHSKLETLNVDNTSNTVFASTNLTGSTPESTFGSMDFAVDQLVFHSTNNTKFTVTFAIDAVAKDINDN